MSAADAILRGRARAEMLHTDRYNVLRPTGMSEPDENNWEPVPTYSTIHSGIAGKFQTGQAQARDTETPGVIVAETSLFWHTSLAFEGILTGDIVVCLEAEDPDLVGTRARIAGPFLKSWATSRRFQVTVVS